MDMSAVSAALSSYHALKDIAQSMIGLRDAAAFQGKLIEFQGKLLDAQASVFAVNDERTSLLERIGELEKDVANLEAWETQKKRYSMIVMQSGSIAYALKPEAQPAEPTHKICANCFQRQKISMLQPVAQDRASAAMNIPPRLRCSECKTEIII